MTDTVRTVLLAVYLIYASAKEVYAYVKGTYSPYIFARGKRSEHFVLSLVDSLLLVLVVAVVSGSRYWLLSPVLASAVAAGITTILNCLVYRKSKDKRILAETIFVDLLAAVVAGTFLWIGHTRGLV